MEGYTTYEAVSPQLHSIGGIGVLQNIADGSWLHRRQCHLPFTYPLKRGDTKSLVPAPQKSHNLVASKATLGMQGPVQDKEYKG